VKILLLVAVGLYLFIGSNELSANEANQPITLHWGINLEPIEYFEIAAFRFKQNVETRTGGKVKVKLTIGKYKQDERDHLKDVQDGTYDMGQEVVNNLIPVVQEFKVWELPFLFENDTHVFKYTDSNFAKASLEKLKKQNVVAFDYTYSGGFIHTVGKKLNSPNDLKDDLLLTEASSSEYVDNLKSILKIKDVKDYGDRNYPTKDNIHEIISSVLEELYEFNDDKVRFLNETRHRVFTRVLFINQDFLNKLPPEFQRIIIEEGQLAARFERQLSLEASNHHLEYIKKHVKHIKVNHWSLAKRIEFRKIFKSVYKKFDEQYGRGTTDKIISLGNFRNMAAN
jgi:TRAP-type C4-dicarboxylate transport system substrate-binding protein